MSGDLFFSLNIYMNTQTTTQITIQDLVAIKELIDLACSRGAFRGNEARAVGEIYEKLSAFLDAVVAKAQADAQTDAQSQGEAE